jgi:hypothetical protein
VGLVKPSPTLFMENIVDKNILDMNPHTKIVVEQKVADKFGISRSTTAGELAKAFEKQKSKAKKLVQPKDTTTNF